MSKKKKHIQTEKERLYQEEAAKKRAEKAEKTKKDTRKAWLALLAVSVGFFVVSLVFFGLNIARMRNFELNYIRTQGTIVGYNVHHDTPSSSSHHTTSYTPIFSYTYNGQKYRAEDWEAYRSPSDRWLGQSVEIYVNPNNPQKAVRLSTADGFSVLFIFIYAMALLPFSISVAGLVAQKYHSYAKRLLCVWLPVVLLCFVLTLFLWLGLPHNGYFTLFSRVRGGVGLAVIAGAYVLFALIDGMISLHLKRRSNTVIVKNKPTWMDEEKK